MKLLLDFFPIILFFITFKTWGIMAATAVAIAATLLQIGYLWRKNGFVEPMQWVSLGVIVVFGGATLLTQDETFIKWKPTVLYWFFAGSLLIEVIFSLDGLGLLSFEAAINRDYPVVFGTLFLFTLLGLLLKLVGDLTYTLVDPRIDFESRAN